MTATFFEESDRSAEHDLCYEQKKRDDVRRWQLRALQGAEGRPGDSATTYYVVT